MVNEEYNSLIQITCVPHLHKIHYIYCPLTQHAVSFLAELPHAAPTSPQKAWPL